MTGCAVVIFDKPTEGSFNAFVSFALAEECVLRSGASEFHCFVSFYVFKVSDFYVSARIIFSFFQLLALP